MLLSLNVYFWLSALLTKLSQFLETVIFHISNVILQYFDKKKFYFLIKYIVSAHCYQLLQIVGIISRQLNL